MKKRIFAVCSRDINEKLLVLNALYCLRNGRVQQREFLVVFVNIIALLMTFVLCLSYSYIVPLLLLPSSLVFIIVALQRGAENARVGCTAEEIGRGSSVRTESRGTPTQCFARVEGSAAFLQLHVRTFLLFLFQAFTSFVSMPFAFSQRVYLLERFSHARSVP